MTSFEISLPGYELIEKIGSGGMATVWKARQQSLDRLVAIKFLPMASIQGADATERFRMETHIAARLRHPGIVQVFDAGETQGVAYVIMELVDGCTMGDRIRKRGVIEESMALAAAEEVAQALAYAWEKECLIHCDVKPDNMLIEESTGGVKLSDLGLARLIGPQSARSEMTLIIGTPNYMSPEQARGDGDLDCRTDMYALGASLYHMVTGELPFGGGVGSEAMERQIHDTLTDPCEVNPQVSEAMGWLIEGLMAKDRTYRPAFWSSVLKDLGEVRRGRFPAHRPTGEHSTIRRGGRRSQELPPIPPAAATKAGVTRPKIKVREDDLAQRKHSPKPREVTAGDATGPLAMVALLAVVLYGGVFWFSNQARTWQQERERLPEVMANPEVEAAQSFLIDEDFEDVMPGDGMPDDAAWQHPDHDRGMARLREAHDVFNDWQVSRESTESLVRAEALARAAVVSLESVRGEAPASAKLDASIRDAYRLISGIRASTPMGVTLGAIELDDLELESAKVESVDVEPVTTAGRVTLPADWAMGDAGREEVAEDWFNLLNPYANASEALTVTDRVLLMGNLRYLDDLDEVLKVLGATEVSSGPLSTPGFPGSGLTLHKIDGASQGQFEELWVVTDRARRVVLLQWVSRVPSPARIDPKYFSARWQTVDLVKGEIKPYGEMRLVHRLRPSLQVFRVESEAMKEEGEVWFRAVTVLPAHFAGLMLHRVATMRGD